MLFCEVARPRVLKMREVDDTAISYSRLAVFGDDTVGAGILKSLLFTVTIRIYQHAMSHSYFG